MSAAYRAAHEAGLSWPHLVGVARGIRSPFQNRRKSIPGGSDENILFSTVLKRRLDTVLTFFTVRGFSDRLLRKMDSGFRRNDVRTSKVLVSDATEAKAKFRFGVDFQDRQKHGCFCGASRDGFTALLEINPEPELRIRNFELRFLKI